MIEQMTLIQPMKLWEPVEGLRSPEPAEKGRDGAEKSEGTLFSSILATAIQQVYDTSAEVGEKQYLLATGPAGRCSQPADRAGQGRDQHRSAGHSQK